MLRKYRNAVILILIGLAGAAAGIFANVAANLLNEPMKPYPWLPWLLFGLFTITGVTFAIWQSRTSEQPLQPLSQANEKRNRQIVLKLVNDIWVEGALQKSLYNETLLELGMETKPNAVESQWSMTISIPAREPKQISPGTRMLDLLNQANGSLLILGQPGSGKTTLLLELASEAIACANNDVSQPLPIVLNLSSWSPKRTIAEWLKDELIDKYHFSEQISRLWIENDDLLLLLDGFDEIRSEYRDDCIDAINLFRNLHSAYLVICSRISEYEILDKRLKLGGAIVIQDLTLPQINQYLQTLGNSLTLLQQVINRYPRLKRIIRTPLMLNILILTFHNATREEINGLEKVAFTRKSLFDNYIEKMFQRRVVGKQFSSEQTKRYLKWLAQKMMTQSQVIFSIDDMHLGGIVPSIKLFRELTLLRALPLASFYGLLFGFLTRLVKTEYMWFGVLVGLLFGGFTGGFLDNGQTTDKLVFSWKKFIFWFPFGVFQTSLAGISASLTSEIPYQINYQTLIIALLISPISGIIFGLIGGLKSQYIPIRNEPEQGLWATLMNGLVISFLIGSYIGLGIASMGKPIIGLALGLALFFMFELPSGGLYLVLHISYRLVLYRANLIPWHYKAFLDYCTDRIFLHKVGGGYIFINRMLMEHFAEMEIPQPETK